jgi:hypothetical protein
MTQMITLHITTRNPAIWRAAAILGGSLFFLLLKTGLVSAVDAVVGWPAWLNYLIVTVAVTLLGWVYHSKVSFRLPLSRVTLRRYLAQAIALKVLDNVLYNVFVYLLGVGVTVAVLVTGSTVFVIRFSVYVKYVFAPSVESADIEIASDQLQSHPRGK